MAALAAVTLLWHGTVLDRAWALNPRAYKQLAPVSSVAGPLFLLLCALLISAAIGWFKHRRWGWRLTVAIMAIQMSGDMFNLLRGDWLGGAVGVTIAGALLLYLFKSGIRTTFSQSAD